MPQNPYGDPAIVIQQFKVGSPVVGEVVSVSPSPDGAVVSFTFPALSKLPVSPSSVTITGTDGEVFTDDGVGNLSGAVSGATGTINYIAGTGTLVYPTDTIVGEAVVVSPTPDAAVLSFTFPALLQLQVVPSSVTITGTDGETFTDDGAGNLTGAPAGASGTIDYVAGTGTLVYPGGSAPAVGVTYSADYQAVPDAPAAGTTYFVDYGAVPSITGVTPIDGAGEVEPTVDVVTKGRIVRYVDCIDGGKFVAPDQWGMQMAQILVKAPGASDVEIIIKDTVTGIEFSALLSSLYTQLTVDDFVWVFREMFLPPGWELLVKATGALIGDGEIVIWQGRGWEITPFSLVTL